VRSVFSETGGAHKSINQSIYSFKEQDKKARGALTIAQISAVTKKIQKFQSRHVLTSSVTLINRPIY